MTKRSKKIATIVGSIIGIAWIGIIVFFFIGFKFLESIGPCGYNDGPFIAMPIENIEISERSIIFNLPEEGKLILDNRNDSLSPIFTLIEDGKRVWTIDTDISNTEKYNMYSIRAISKLEVKTHKNTINLSFIADWSFGNEGGTMEINRKTGENSFCLSW